MNAAETPWFFLLPFWMYTSTDMLCHSKAEYCWHSGRHNLMEKDFPPGQAQGRILIGWVWIQYPSLDQSLWPTWSHMSNLWRRVGSVPEEGRRGILSRCSGSHPRPRIAAAMETSQALGPRREALCGLVALECLLSL